MDNLDILFFSRGRGRGHAIPDMAILESLRSIAPDLRISVYTYGSGLAAFHQAGHIAFDLDLPNECNPIEVIQRVSRVLRRTPARLLVSHEEFGAIPAAHIFELPSVFLTHWFASQESIPMQALAAVDHILFIENEGHFLEPDYLQGRIKYCGPILRRFTCLPSDRQRLRKELGIEYDEAVFAVFPGGWSERQAPILDLVLDAFKALPRERKRLIWVTANDYETTVAKCLKYDNIMVLENVQQPERLMAASDVGLTKGTYNIGRELCALGIPSVSISYGHNPVDDYFSRSLSSNTFLYAEETLPTALALHMEAALERGLFAPNLAAMDGSSAIRIAGYLLEILHSCAPPRP